MKHLQRVVLGIILISLSGCWGQVDIEKVGPILQLGVEAAPKGRIIVTHSFPVFGAASKKQDELVSMQTDNLRESREIWRRISPQIPQGGKVQQYLFAADFARQGITPWMEVFQRDPINPPLISVVIVDGSPKELMEKAANFKDKPRTALYITQLLDNNNNQYAAVDDIFRFTIAYFAPGLDPVAPIIKLEPKDIRLTGTALFHGDRMVGSINIDQTIMLLALMGRLREAEYIFRHPAPLPGMGPGKPAAAARLTVAKRKIEIRLIHGRPVVEVNLLFSGVLDEYRWDQMDRSGAQHKLEQSFAKELTGLCNHLIGRLQQVGSDPIGIGDRIRAKFYRYWLRNKPGQIYQATQFKVKVKMHLTKYGAIK
ncbi:MAG TPA: Ger(x)C family spore germination protein [Bacillota bacterium]